MILECDGSDGSNSPQAGDEPSGPLVHSELGLDGFATSLCWDTIGKRVVVAVTSPESPQVADRLCLCETLGRLRSTNLVRSHRVTQRALKIDVSPVSLACRGDESLVEYVSLPAGAQATCLSFYAEEKRKAWVAVSCTDGAVRLIDASPERTASVVRTSYSHGVKATAVAFSSSGGQVASGSSSGHVVVQPFHGSGPTPLPGASAVSSLGAGASSTLSPGLLETTESPIESLCYSSLRQDESYCA